MSDVEITIKLPQEVVARAQAAGIQIESQTERIVAMLLEAEIKRREAGQRLNETMNRLWALDDKPTPEEIEEEIRAARAE